MTSSLVAIIKREAHGKSKIEMALVAVTAILLASGFLYFGTCLP